MKVQHYDDETIIAFVTGEDESDSATAIRRRHLTTCPDCADVVDEYRQILEAAGKEAVWDFRELRLEEKPSAQTLTTLRNFVDEMAREDAEAEPRLAELLSGPRETWSSHLTAHPEWRTAGMVRKLIAATDRAIDTMPPDALEITKLAVDIAESLDPERHVSDTVLKLRGQAWRERAYALFYVGSLRPALVALDTADKHFADCALAEYDAARCSVVRALILRGLDEVDIALAHTQGAGAIFRHFGDERKHATARSSEALLRYKARDFRGALQIYTELAKQDAGDAGVARDRARTLQTIAHCYRELGEFDRSAAYSNEAMNLFSQLGMATEAVRARWNIAKLSIARGDHQTAAVSLREVRARFAAIGMVNEFVLATLDLAEVLLLLHLNREVRALCDEVLETLRAAALDHTDRARTAIAFLKEANVNGTLTPAVVRHVNKYFDRLRHEPMLLFAPPPF